MPQPLQLTTFTGVYASHLALLSTAWSVLSSLLTLAWTLVSMLTVALPLPSESLLFPEPLGGEKRPRRPHQRRRVGPGAKPARFTVLLDLDETLVYAYNARLPNRPQPSGSPHFSVVASGTVFSMHERPGLRPFLEQLASFADVFVFTASSAGYARPVVDYLDPERRLISGCFYREDTVATPEHCFVKDLAALGFGARRLPTTVLVDNNPLSFLRQPANGVPCVPFFGCGNDGQLLTVVLPLLEALSVLPDVRPTLIELFQLPQWFRSRGCLPRPLSNPLLETCARSSPLTLEHQLPGKGLALATPGHSQPAPRAGLVARRLARLQVALAEGKAESEILELVAAEGPGPTAPIQVAVVC